MGSELCCQNFDLVKFRKIIMRNSCYGTFFSQNFESEFSNNSDPPAEPKLESVFWPNSDPSSGLNNLVRTSSSIYFCIIRLETGTMFHVLHSSSTSVLDSSNTHGNTDGIGTVLWST